MPDLLRKMNVDPARVAKDARESARQACRRRTAAPSPACRRGFKLVIDQAQAEAERLKDEFVSTEHLFVAHRRRERAAPRPRSS